LKISGLARGNYARKGGDIVPLPDKIESLKDLEELEIREDEFEGAIIPLDESLAKALIQALERRGEKKDKERR
jgi:hypothetical protein